MPASRPRCDRLNASVVQVYGSRHTTKEWSGAKTTCSRKLLSERTAIDRPFDGSRTSAVNQPPSRRPGVDVVDESIPDRAPLPGHQTLRQRVGSGRSCRGFRRAPRSPGRRRTSIRSRVPLGTERHVKPGVNAEPHRHRQSTHVLGLGVQTQGATVHPGTRRSAVTGTARRRPAPVRSRCSLDRTRRRRPCRSVRRSRVDPASGREWRAVRAGRSAAGRPCRRT